MANPKTNRKASRAIGQRGPKKFDIAKFYFQRRSKTRRRRR